MTDDQRPSDRTLSSAAGGELPENPLSAASAREKGDHGYTEFADEVFAPIYPWICKDVENALGKPLRGLRILEIGGGPGHMAEEFLFRHPARLIELDISPIMLAVAHARIVRSGNHPKTEIALLCGSPEFLPLPDGCVDLIFSRGSAQFWPDLEGALREFCRVAAPGCGVYIGGGYGLSTPESLKNQVIANRERYFQERPGRGRSIRFLDMDHLLGSVRILGGSSELLGAGRGQWLFWRVSAQKAGGK